MCERVKIEPEPRARVHELRSVVVLVGDLAHCQRSNASKQCLKRGRRASVVYGHGHLGVGKERLLREPHLDMHARARGHAAAGEGVRIAQAEYGTEPRLAGGSGGERVEVGEDGGELCLEQVDEAPKDDDEDLVGIVDEGLQRLQRHGLRLRRRLAVSLRLHRPSDREERRQSHRGLEPVEAHANDARGHGGLHEECDGG
mmetsp:Transcript_44236/g.109513  ORF Transcript_44236/g.109513 Transcript_44236/m.109513 type:complete len:200 (+) Transcript_44236:498-1097(+)